MTEIWLIVALFILLFGIVALRFCVLLHSLKNRDEDEYNRYDREWLYEDYLRHSKYYED